MLEPPSEFGWRREAAREDPIAIVVVALALSLLFSLAWIHARVDDPILLLVLDTAKSLVLPNVPYIHPIVSAHRVSVDF